MKDPKEMSITELKAALFDLQSDMQFLMTILKEKIEAEKKEPAGDKLPKE